MARTRDGARREEGPRFRGHATADRGDEPPHALRPRRRDDLQRRSGEPHHPGARGRWRRDATRHGHATGSVVAIHARHGRRRRARRHLRGAGRGSR